MVGGEIASPSKGERFRGLTWAKGETAIPFIRTPIINGVVELYHTTRAIGCYMEGCSVGYSQVCPIDTNLKAQAKTQPDANDVLEL